MTDPLNRRRVQRLRESRRSQGLKEASVWLDKSIDTAIAQAVERGCYPSRQAAMSAALELVFVQRNSKTMT